MSASQSYEVLVPLVELPDAYANIYTQIGVHDGEIFLANPYLPCLLLKDGEWIKVTEN